ncbi:MAG TPA: tetratricopeptide repeat protein, partial [Candidatus Binatia bacterium]|nr:tetratricopeptide repeat protein [Candidatus Binatia bacterium]
EKVAKTPEPGSGQSASVEELARRLRPSVVVVSHFGRDGKEDGVGAGFIISSNGLIATSLHVIGEARPITVRLANGREYEVTEVHASDRNLDLAIVRIDANALQGLPLGDSDQLRQGSPVVAMGNPLGMEHSVVQGVVSARRDFESVQMIQLAIPIEPGNSGGPLVDMQGRVHGLLTLKSVLSANLGFAMPINELKKLIEKPNPVPMSRWLTIGALNLKEWEPLMGARWQQRGGRIQVDGAGKGFGGRSLCLSHKPVPEPPYDVTVSVRLDDESGAAGLVFDADGKDIHYGFYSTSGQLRLTRFEGPAVFSWTILTTTNTAHYQQGEWNHLRVRVEKEKVLCYVNDHLIVESDDRVLSSGRAGLAKFRNTKAEFKDFRIGTNVVSPATASPEVVAKLKAELRDVDPSSPKALEPVLAKDPEAAYRVANEQANDFERRAARLRQLATKARQQAIERELVKLMKAPEEQIDLFHAALLVSQLDNPDLDVASYRQQLETITAEVKTGLPANSSNDQRLKHLIDYLFQQNGFHGSRSDYYHRANSYIDRVVDDREGLPITLAILFLELARRTGIKDVSGAPLSGHFMVLYNPAPGKERFIDVFDGGKMLTLSEAEEVASQASQTAVRGDFTSATKKEIIIRILRNLANWAERSESPKNSLRYLDLVVALAPDAPLERLGRAMARLGTGDTPGAREDLQFVIEANPPGVDLRRIEDLFRRLQRIGE